MTNNFSVYACSGKAPHLNECKCDVGLVTEDVLNMALDQQRYLQVLAREPNGWRGVHQQNGPAAA